MTYGHRRQRTINDLDKETGRGDLIAQALLSIPSWKLVEGIFFPQTHRRAASQQENYDQEEASHSDRAW